VIWHAFHGAPPIPAAPALRTAAVSKPGGAFPVSPIRPAVPDAPRRVAGPHPGTPPGGGAVRPTTYVHPAADRPGTTADADAADSAPTYHGSGVPGRRLSAIRAARAAVQGPTVGAPAAPGGPCTVGPATTVPRRWNDPGPFGPATGPPPTDHALRRQLDQPLRAVVVLEHSTDRGTTSHRQDWRPRAACVVRATGPEPTERASSALSRAAELPNDRADEAAGP